MKNFTKYIEQSIAKHWQYKALSNYKGETLLYKDIATQIIKTHQFFKDLGINENDKIAQIGKNNANWATVFLSVISYGTVSVPLLQDFPYGDIENTVNHSDAVLVFISDYIFENIDASKFPKVRGFISLDTLEILHCNDKNVKKAAKNYLKKDLIIKQNEFKLKEFNNDKLATISYTSGTSGMSKGVILSHGNYATNIDFGFQVIPFNVGDKVVSCLPLAHAYGLAFEFLVEFMQGCQITFLGKIPSPQVILQAFSDIKPRLVVLVPLIIEKIYHKKVKPAISSGLPHLLLGIPLLKKLVHKKVKKQLEDAFGGNFIEVIIGGAALNKEVESFLKRIGFRYSVGYGMTECAPLISFTNWNKTKKFSCGKPIPHCDIKIDSPDPEHIEGEIMVKGSQVMLGYYKNKEATDECFEGKWLKTGDLGTKDSNGFITIKGRSKNMILGASGQNIYPEEIEARINNMPYVAESLVIEKQGRLHALIFPDIEKVEQRGFNNNKILAEFKKNQKELNKQMPNYMSIARVEVQDQEFIKTPKKSIKRYLYVN